MPHLIAILEDDPGRTAEMRRCVDILGGTAECVFAESAPGMMAVLEDIGPAVSLVSLDHDLRPLSDADGKSRAAGTGMEVAEWLAECGAYCTILVHTSDNLAARGMVSAMELAGVKAERIVPWGDLEWVEASWLPAVLRALPDDG
ncbi:MAG: cyclic-phosphate processing receiver domain-containing protein [Planctomycetota bacterium]